MLSSRLCNFRCCRSAVPTPPSAASLLRCSSSSSPLMDRSSGAGTSSSGGKRSRAQVAAAAAAVQPPGQAFASPPGPSSSGAMQQHKQRAPVVFDDMTTSDSDSDSGPLRVPLKLAVQDAVKRWFNETLSEARRGDVKQQALLAQMLAQGYGCKQDPEEARRWAERARARGYSMSGVYCEL